MGVTDPGSQRALHAIAGGKTDLHAGSSSATIAPAGPDERLRRMGVSSVSTPTPLLREARYLLAEETESGGSRRATSVLARFAAQNQTGEESPVHAAHDVRNAHPRINVLEDAGLVAREASSSGRAVDAL